MQQRREGVTCGGLDLCLRVGGFSSLRTGVQRWSLWLRHRVGKKGRAAYKSISAGSCSLELGMRQHDGKPSLKLMSAQELDR